MAARHSVTSVGHCCMDLSIKASNVKVSKTALVELNHEEISSALKGWIIGFNVWRTSLLGNANAVHVRSANNGRH